MIWPRVCEPAGIILTVFYDFRVQNLALYTIWTEHSPGILTATCDKKSGIMG